jgi:hypothetical protein
MDPRRVSTIESWPIPKSYRDIQVFIGFCNFYRRFIRDFSRIARPLTSLLKGSQNGRKPGKLDLSGDESAAFRQLIEAFKTAPLLRHFDPTKQIRLETDASKYGMAGVLSQPDDQNTYHPVAFWSRKFTDTEVNYATPDQELFAIVYSFKHWRHYLEGSRYTIEVLSDHANLQAFMRQPKINGRQARWCMSLIPFDFIIKHRSGKSNPADAPSRLFERTGDAQDPDILGQLYLRIGSETVPKRAGSAAAVQSLSLDDLISHKSQFETRDDGTVRGEHPSQLPYCGEHESSVWAVWEDLARDQRIP